ncbi:hypothetical protein GALMADRAFT_279957 [Galerina marginata CBS 339.88]|uniref:Uncharacterized protein n=1 Tax=Galerina marginata (strain CBS 339.88) TaxID=685588 RepID=A0A067SW65_GALM3|nr:hypothetical protein GALMADRAFT_279957 [Galerina marginata CBS 339.88]
MNLSFYTSEFTLQVSQISPTSIPGTLWAYYIEYLWLYKPDSWVARMAYSFRVLAILVSLPIVILGLLDQDIASYGIARTLGVIDDVKASTSDKATVHAQPPSIQLNGTISPSSDSAFSDSDRDSLIDHTMHNKMRSPLSDSTSSLPPVFYAEDKLSGVGLFSPAASQPPSPTSSRRHLPLSSVNGAEHLRYRTQPLGIGIGTRTTEEND